MSPLAQFLVGSTAGLTVFWVLWRGFQNDDPFREFAEGRALVALRETYESNDWDAQLIEIRNLPESDPWRGVA